jgi:prephenate dehydrogenase
MEPEFIGVVGGNGRMGGLFARLFRDAGYRVVSIDRADGPSDWGRIAECPVVLLAVPITQIENVLRRIGPIARKDGAIIDVCSIKAEPIDLMRKYAPGDVIGCHPLFGPSTENLRERTVFLCPGRGDRWLGWWRDFLENKGASVVEIEAARHDRLMARVQVLRHLMLFSFGITLTRLDFNIEDDLPLAGPWFNSLIDLLAGQFQQPPDLYADLALNNPEAPGVLAEFMKAVGDVAGRAAEGDRDALIALIGEAAAGLKRTGAADETTENASSSWSTGRLTPVAPADIFY